MKTLTPPTKNSNNGDKSASAKIITAPSSGNFDKDNNILIASWLDTPLGQMLAIADEQALYLLEFADRPGLKNKIEQLKSKTKSLIISQRSSLITSIKAELKSFFDGTLREFKTPVGLFGSTFQKLAWHALITIPYGHTRSYAEQAILVGKQFAYRAVANANIANQIAIVIPCHRIINSNGALGGYSGGIGRKKWLIAHEQQRHR